MPLSPRKKKKLTYAAIFGTVAGIMVFTIFYTMNNNPVYLVFIPLTIAMGCGYAFVYPDRDEEDEE
jgi:uncharacterized integral membrane protein